MWLFHPILNLKSQFCFKKLLYFWLLKIWLFGNFNLSLHESKCYGYTIFLVAFWLGAHTPFLCDRCILLSLQKLPTFSGVCCKTLGCTHVHTPFFLVKWEGVFKWCNPKIQVLIIIGFLVLNVQKSFRKIHCKKNTLYLCSCGLMRNRKMSNACIDFNLISTRMPSLFVLNHKKV